MLKTKGQFIVFEGIDGSGKATQTNLLFNYFKTQGKETMKIDFPQHGEKSCGLVDEYLNGKYGKAHEVGPYIASIFYACDRYDASFKIRKWLEEGKVVIADRYLASNIGHQGGKIKDEKQREAYIDWLYKFEYGLFKVPKPDKTIILKTNPEYSLKLSNQITDQEKIEKRKAYLGDDKKQDIHEQDQTHLKNTLFAYLEAAEKYPADFAVIDCLNEQGQLLAPDVIHQRVVERIENP